MKQRGEKRIKRNEDNFRDLWDNVKSYATFKVEKNV